MRLVIFSPFDDIKEDGTVLLWHMKDGADPNEQYECRCIWGMLTAKELFDLVWGQSSVDVERDRVNQFCRLVG